MFNVILDNINKIAAVSSKNEKQLLLAQYMRDEHFKKIVTYMLDPLPTFGILEYQGGCTASHEHPYKVLDKLISRELSGAAARIAAGALVAGGFPGELMLRILAKDPKAGFADSTVNKVLPGLIQEFPYQRCSLPKEAKMETWDWKGGVPSQEKADGMYANLDYHLSGDFTLRSRQGSEFPIEKFSNLTSFTDRLIDRNTQTQGELLVRRAGEILPREIGNGVLNSVLKGGDFEVGDTVLFKVWDQIPLNAVAPKVKYMVPYKVRLGNLYKQIGQHTEHMPIHLIETKMVHSIAEAYAHCKELMLKGKEGTIVSEPNAPWIDGTSKFKVKLKLEFNCDLKIVGFRPGKGKNASTFGSIICRTSDGLLEVGVSGFPDKKGKDGKLTRAEIWARRDELLETVMAVTANLVTPPPDGGHLWSLFLPRCLEFRLDKTIADTLQQVKDAQQAAIDTLAAVQ